MITVDNRNLAVALSIYVIAVLGVSALLTPLPLTIAPIMLIILHLGLLWRSTPRFALIANCFTFFAVAIMVIPLLGPYFSCLPPLPILALINKSLRKAGEADVHRRTLHRLNPTQTLLTLAEAVLWLFVIGLLLGSITLIITCSVFIAYIGIMAILALKSLFVQPVTANPIVLRAIAGSSINQTVKLACKTTGGMLFLESPYPWLTLKPSHIPLITEELTTDVRITTDLSGPLFIACSACATDCLGLIQHTFRIRPILLHVIPRARYAAWIANKYIRETKPGMLPLTSNVSANTPILGLRTGVEYYGSRPYQPGDSLKSVDWRHSVRYQQLVTKEFHELHGRPTVLLANLVAKDAEEADKLAHRIVTTSVSLAYEGIPAVLAAYDSSEVKLVTGILDPKELVSASLRLLKNIAIEKPPSRFLAYGNAAVIKADARRLRSIDSSQARALVQLLNLEYRNLVKSTVAHPTSRTLLRALAKIGKQSNVISISGRNHDAQALATQLSALSARGNTIITV